jgi:ATP-dependent Clp protease protease subunit
MKPAPIELPLGVEPSRSATRPFARSSGRPVELKAAGADAVIVMFGEVGFDITPSGVKSALSAAAGKPVTLEIDSGGGDAFSGISIYNLLVQYPAPVTSKVLGLAASAASVIAMAGDKVLIGENAFLMVHRSWGICIGNCVDHADQAEVLAGVDQALALTYAGRTERTPDEMLTLMQAETWMMGADAVEQGFADGLLPTPSRAAARAWTCPGFVEG